MYFEPFIDNLKQPPPYLLILGYFFPSFLHAALKHLYLFNRSYLSYRFLRPSHHIWVTGSYLLVYFWLLVILWGYYEAEEFESFYFKDFQLLPSRTHGQCFLSDNAYKSWCQATKHVQLHRYSNLINIVKYQLCKQQVVYIYPFHSTY